MDFGIKSAFMKGLFIGGCILCLVACGLVDDADIPHVFGPNEVPPEALAEPRLVPVPPAPDPRHPAWPRLGDVPSKPEDFSSPAAIARTFQQMENDRAEAQAQKQEIDNLPPSP